MQYQLTKKPKAMILTNEQIEKINKREITEAILTDGSKVRIFFGINGYLCQFKKGSRKYGYVLDENRIQSLVEPKVKKVKTPDEINFKMISKFRKEALKATFTNEFIRDCIALPDTFEKWVNEGKKSPYEYSITTGCKITGDLVSIKSLAKKNYWLQRLSEAIKNKENFLSGRFDLYGYDGSIQFKKEDNGDFKGWLSKEYRDCGNGYYYLLINDEYFIGYDID